MKHKIKKGKNNLKVFSIIIISILIIMIIGILMYRKLVPIYNVSDRTQVLSKKQKEDETVIGWLKVQGTNIDYPVVYSGTDKFENEDYDYDYLWTNSDSTKLNTRAIVWGHNIRNVSSKPLINEKTFNYFENLPSYLYYDFVKQNKYIQYTIDGKNYLYKIYAVSMVEKEEFSNNEYMDQSSRKEYIEKTKKNSYFDFDTEVDEKKELITLVTCTRFFNKTTSVLKVDGVLVDKNEKINNYNVKKKKNYTTIEETMKGDEDDESEEV